MDPEANEINRPPLDNFTTLQNARLDAALAQSETKLKSVANYSPANAFLETNSNATYDHGMVNIQDLMALDALGVNPTEVLNKTGRDSGPENETIANISLPNSELLIRRYSDGFTRYLQQPGERNAKALDGELIKQKLSERYASSPTHQAIASLKDKLADSNGVNGGISTEPFDGYEDALATIDFLTTTGVISSIEAVRKLRSGVEAKEIIDQAIANVPEYFGRSIEDEKERSVKWKTQGLDFSLSQDKQNGLFTYTVNKDPASLYWEVANQTPEVTEIPFIETQCGKELCKVLDSKGLKFSHDLEAEIVRPGQAERYGGVYTQLTREIAKWIDDPEKLALSKLVVPSESKNTYLEPEEEDELETKTRQLWLSNKQEIEGEAAQVITSLIDQLLSRDPQLAQQSDLPVTQEKTKIRDGACFDVFGYYLGAGASYSKPLTEINEGNNVRLLEKTLGSHTYMTVDPITFNGISLPKGSLFSRAKDGGWALLRLTPFSFDKPIDQQAFGSEIAKAYLHESHSIAYLGGTSLRHLVEAAR